MAHVQLIEGKVHGVFALPQPGNSGYAEIADDDPRLIAFLNPGARLVRKSLIIERLNTAGKLAAASAVLNSDIYARERWYAPDQPGVYADNAEVLALLKAIGADSDAILASE